jgi:hypothetical protein
VDRCKDGTLNGDETDVDCGGDSCPRCALGASCQEDNDCGEGLEVCRDTCLTSQCAGACDERAEYELCVDGPPAECLGGNLPTCLDTCKQPEDADFVVCVRSCFDVCGMETKTCAVSCTDGQANGDETDVDCGGSCLPCAVPSESPPEDLNLSPNVVVEGKILMEGVTEEDWNYSKELQDQTTVGIANAAEAPFDQVSVFMSQPPRRRLQETGLAVYYEVQFPPTTIFIEIHNLNPECSFFIQQIISCLGKCGG